MTERKLSRDETDYMRSYIKEGIDRGESEAQLKYRAMELTEIFECTRSQVSGAISWKEKDGNGSLILEPREKYDSEKKSQVQEGQPQDPLSLNSLENPIQSPSENLVFLKTGGNANQHEYDNPTKNEWRKKEMQFLGRMIPKGKRATAKILCLPAAKCLEIPLYIEMGFNSANIFGVMDSDDTALVDEFLRNAKRYGFNPYVGDLGKMLEKDSTRYEVVVLDFEGPASMKTRMPCDQVLLAEDSVVMINMMARRDPARTSEEFANLFVIHQSVDLVKDSGFGSFANVIDKFAGLNSPKAITEDYPIADTRSLGMRRFAEMYGRNRDENLLVDYERLQKIWLKAKKINPNLPDEPKLQERGTIAVYIDDLFQSVVMPLLEPVFMRHGFDQIAAKKIRMQLKCVVTEALSAVPYVQDYEKWKYKSEDAGTPYVSFFMRMKTPLKALQDMMPTAEFFLRFLEDVVDSVLVVCPPPQYAVVNVKGRPKNEGLLAENDRFVYRYQNKIQKELPFFKLCNDIRNYQKTCKYAPGWVEDRDEPTLITV